MPPAAVVMSRDVRLRGAQCPFAQLSRDDSGSCCCCLPKLLLSPLCAAATAAAAARASRRWGGCGGRFLFKNESSKCCRRETSTTPLATPPAAASPRPSPCRPGGMARKAVAPLLPCGGGDDAAALASDVCSDEGVRVT
ncbi:unnamed protein product, partial [Ectocarpus sp. 12 AP-2014]